MTAARFCPECQAVIPPNSPEGLCPACLLRAGLRSGVVSESQPQATESHSPPEFIPPKPEELAARFPQLEILELLGRGGMGAVYKARQRNLDRLVAVKILAPEISRDPAFAQRFRLEAQALARLSHQHIVTIHDFGKMEGLFYFVMEFVDGVNLRQAMEAGKIAPREALKIVTQVCEALQFAHDEGIVHRDIKPANILIDKRGRAKIADFGLAKLLGDEPRDQELTGTHQVMGTPRYMAPEQMEGSKAIDHRADIYSLGVVFYELLTGELPIGRFAPPSKKVQVDVRLDDVVLRALEKEPELRYQHASDVKTAVEAISSMKAAPANKPVAIDPHEVEKHVLPLLPHKMGEAIKLYEQETGVRPLEAAMAVQTIMRIHGLKRPLRQTATEMTLVVGGLIAFLAVAFFAQSWWRFLSPVVYVPIVLLAALYGAVYAWRYRGENRGRAGLVVLSLILIFAIWLPFFYFLGDPEPVLARLYEWTGIAPGPYDTGFLRALHIGVLVCGGGVILWASQKVFRLGLKMRAFEIAAAATPRERAMKLIEPPARGLVATGALQFLTSFIWLPLAIQDEMPALIAVVVVGVTIGSLILIGALRMRKLKSYLFSRLTCILAILPLGFGCLYGIPFGIWALRVLRNPQVRDSFSGQTEPKAEVTSRS